MKITYYNRILNKNTFDVIITFVTMWEYRIANSHYYIFPQTLLVIFPKLITAKTIAIYCDASYKLSDIYMLAISLESNLPKTHISFFYNYTENERVAQSKK